MRPDSRPGDYATLAPPGMSRLVAVVVALVLPSAIAADGALEFALRTDYQGGQRVRLQLHGIEWTLPPHARSSQHPGRSEIFVGFDDNPTQDPTNRLWLEPVAEGAAGDEGTLAANASGGGTRVWTVASPDGRGLRIRGEFRTAGDVERLEPRARAVVESVRFLPRAGSPEEGLVGCWRSGGFVFGGGASIEKVILYDDGTAHVSSRHDPGFANTPTYWSSITGRWRLREGRVQVLDGSGGLRHDWAVERGEAGVQLGVSSYRRCD